MKKLSFILAYLLLVVPCGAGTIIVDDNGPADFSNIQAAVDAAVNDDTVIVAPGTYTGLGNRDIDFLGKAIIVRSTDPNDPNIVAATIIDCQGTKKSPHRGFYFQNNEDANSVVAGFTIKNGNAADGGGIYCYGSSPTITNCTFSGNSATHGAGMKNTLYSNPTLTNCTFSGNSAANGGGIFNYWSYPTITSCAFSGNSANYGGGIINNFYSSPTVTNCTFSGNSAGYDGGGMYNNASSNPTVTNCTFSGNSASSGGGGMDNYASSSPTVTNCTFSGNSAYYGGGMHNSSGSPTITNCIFSSNPATYGGGMNNSSSSPTITNCTFSGNSASSGGGMSNGHSNPMLTNCILWGNIATDGSQIYNFSSTATISFSDVQGGWAGIANINADPCFVNVDANDYHLSSASPCINTGDPNYVPEPNETDLDGLPRVVGGRIDMGAYEFNHQPIAIAGPNQIAYAWLDSFADVNLDGSASFDDDNDCLDYYWSWTIDGNTYEANGISPTVKLPVGNHTIELVVDDGIDLSEPDYCIITVIRAVRGRLMLSPRVLETKCRGRWILAALFMPPVPGEKVNTKETLRLYPGGIEAKYQRFYRYGRLGHSYTIAFALFDKQLVIDALGIGTTKVSVVGEFMTGRYFFGSDTIKVISTRPKPPYCWHW